MLRSSERLADPARMHRAAFDAGRSDGSFRKKPHLSSVLTTSSSRPGMSVAVKDSLFCPPRVAPLPEASESIDLMLPNVSLHALEEASEPGRGADPVEEASCGRDVELTRKSPACSLTASASVCNAR